MKSLAGLTALLVMLLACHVQVGVAQLTDTTRAFEIHVDLHSSFVRVPSVFLTYDIGHLSALNRLGVHDAELVLGGLLYTESRSVRVDSLTANPEEEFVFVPKAYREVGMFIGARFYLTSPKPVGRLFVDGLVVTKVARWRTRAYVDQLALGIPPVFEERFTLRAGIMCRVGLYRPLTKRLSLSGYLTFSGIVERQEIENVTSMLPQAQRSSNIYNFGLSGSLITIGFRL